ncbi:MAG: hypothetical protein LC623_09335 [Halobacteriales archaeon]|nr:hypothetical protein [Halobacteriales archaeon]
MRLAAALLLVALAGCAAPEQANPLLGLCPQWVAEPGAGHPGSHDGGNGTQVVQPQNLTHLGRPFDLVRLKVDSLEGGPVELRAYAMANGTGGNGNGTRGVQRTWRDFRGEAPQAVPYLVLGPSAVGHEFEAALTSIAPGDAPRPGPVELAWTLPAGGTAHVAYTLSYHYKVCGAA